MNLRALAVAGALATALAGLLGAWWMRQGSPDLPPEVEQALRLRELPPNRWVPYHTERPGWHRQGHAGMAFDARRGSLLIFGSDTHGQDWDNTVHEFKPLLKRWVRHGAVSAPDTYRVDAEGRPVAGGAEPLPWAMHTYDALEVHPGLDALVVASTVDHNPRAATVGGMRRQPTWLFDLGRRQWRLLDTQGEPFPGLFGGSSAYDDRRGVLIGYRGSIWELDADARAWRRAADGHHQLHHTMVFASPRGEAFVFGDYRPTTVVWSYRPGPRAGAPGTWTRHVPEGDPCPPYGIVPVAYDARQDLFVLVVDPPDGKGQASTFLYDPAANRYHRVDGAALPAVGMNFMMAWDPRHEVMFLVTGDAGGTVTVWAFRPRRPDTR